MKASFYHLVMDKLLVLRGKKMELIGVLPNHATNQILMECPFVKKWIISIASLSYYHFNNFTLLEAEEIIKNHIENANLEFIINLEKVYTEDELNKVQELIKIFNEYSNVYFSYSDFGTYQLLIDEKCDRIIYHSSSMVTNLMDTLIATQENSLFIMGKEISKDELIYIDQHLPKKIAIDAFGKFPIFYSKRHLLSNYFKFRGYENNPTDLDYTLVEEFRSEEYPITEQDETIVYEPFFYILGSELSEFKNIGWLVIYPTFLDLLTYTKILTIYQAYIDNDFTQIEGETIEEKIGHMVPLYKGKLTEKTILRKGQIK